MNQIFLCHARDDGEKVEKLYRRLSEAGFKPWMSKKDILADENRENSIRKAIRRSNFFLACLSANSSNQRGFLQKEIKDALDIWREKLDGDIYLIPVRFEECEIPESLINFQCADLFKEEGWPHLVKSIRAGLERQSLDNPKAGGESVSSHPTDRENKLKNEHQQTLARTDMKQNEERERQGESEKRKSTNVIPKILEEYADRFSVATIYIIFAVFSLLAAFVLFWFLHSTGLVKIVSSKYVEHIEIGSASLSFMLILRLLIGNYNRMTKTNEKLYLTGNVLLQDSSPVPSATVFVEGIDRQKTTDPTGWFKIEVDDDQKSWTIRAICEQGKAEQIVSRKDIKKPVRLTIKPN